MSFAIIIFRVCRLLFLIEKRDQRLTRFAGSRAVANQIQASHKELDHFVTMTHLEYEKETWRRQWRDHEASLQAAFEELLSKDDVLASGYTDELQRKEAFLLQHELQACGDREREQTQMQTTMMRVLKRFHHLCEINVLVVVPE